MRTVHHPQERKQSEISEQTPSESDDADDSRPATDAAYRKLITVYCNPVFALPLALLLLLLACLFILFKGDDRRKGSASMSCGWPRISSFKTYVQRLLRGLWRNSRPKRYAR